MITQNRLHEGTKRMKKSTSELLGTFQDGLVFNRYFVHYQSLHKCLSICDAFGTRN